MADFIFDKIDSDKSKRYIYGTYIEMAFHNFFITLQHIYKRVKGEYYTPTQIDFGKEFDTKFIFDDFVNAEDVQMCEKLLTKHFPFLKVIEDDFHETDKRKIIKQNWFFLKSLRNAAEHDVKITNENFANNKSDIIKWLRTDFVSGRDVKKRGIAIAAKKEMKDRFFLLQEPKPVSNFMNNCTSKSGDFTFRSFIVYISLFLEGKYTYLFITNQDIKSRFDYTETNRRTKVATTKHFVSADFVNLYRALSIYNINLPAVKYDAQYDKNNILGLDIINELQKCPHELFEHLSLEDQNKFRVKSGENADFPDDILLKRYQDRFASLVLRYIDNQKIFNDIRFQVSLGKYRYSFYDKQCIDSESKDRVRILQKELKSFGRLDDMEAKRLDEWDGVLRVTDLENQAAADTADTSPYITDQKTRYNLDRHTPKIPLWWDGDCDLPIAKEDVSKGDKHNVNSIVPKAFLSVYDLPAVMFLHLLGGNPEQLIKDYYNGFTSLFADIHNNVLTPDNFVKETFSDKYKVKFCDVPKKFQDYLLGNDPRIPDGFKDFPAKIVRKSLRENEQKQLSAKQTEIVANLMRLQNQLEEDKENIKSGRLAIHLAKSIVSLITDNNIKPTGKNYSVMQANLAVYESFDKIDQMFRRSKIADNHPFLKSVLSAKPKNTLAFYTKYLAAEIEFFTDIDNCANLKFYKYVKEKYAQKNSDYYKALANEYLKKGFVELTGHVFDDAIRQLLSGKIEGIDSLDAKYNVAFLISRYYKEYQPYYDFERKYKIDELNAADEPQDRIRFYERERKNTNNAINRYRIQDKILFEMAKTLLKVKDDASKAQMSDISEMKLSSIMPGSNVFDKPMQDFSVDVTFGTKKLTIVAKDLKVKNYSAIFKTIFDRRLDTLVKLIPQNQVLLSDLKAEFENYDSEALKINKLIFDADDTHRAIPLVNVIRNSFAHWSYPHKDAYKGGAVLDTNLTNLHNKLSNQDLGNKASLLKPELEMALA